jgi:GNAT superfamily N-acetyltransferase
MKDFSFKASFNMTLEFVMENLEKYTFPSIHKQIHAVEITNPIIAVSARKDGDLIGMCLVNYEPEMSHCEIISFYIEPRFRDQGLGSLLLEKTERILEHKGFEQVRTFFWSSWESVESTRHMLKKQEWEEPVKLMQLFRTDIEGLKKIPWRENVDIPEDYAIVPWSWISPYEKKIIREEQDFLAFYPEHLSPFLNQNKIDYHNSIALKYKGKVVGWHMSYWYSPTTLEYSNLFIRKEHRTGMKVPLEMIRRASMMQIEQGVPEVIWLVGLENPNLEEYFESKFGEWCKKIEIFRSVKSLKDQE